MQTQDQRQALGRYGEGVAARWLSAAGMVVLDRNWRCTAGEVDVVLREGDVLVVAEVKTRRNTDCGHPVEAVTPAKAHRLRLLAELWMEAHDVHPADVRVDVVSVLQDGHGAAVVEHVRGVA